MKTQRTKPKNAQENPQADPRLIWLASVLAAAVFVVYVTHV
jgi:hypothetical protein